VKVFRGNKPEIERYIEIFCMQHPMFRDYLFKGAGNALQYLDSEIMLTLLALSLGAGIPVLSVHDEVVFPEPYLPEVKRFLITACQRVLHDAGCFGSLPIKTKVIKQGFILEAVALLNLSKSDTEIES
jgi:hypothetical protein